MLTIADKYSRFPFALPCPNTTSANVTKCIDTMIVLLYSANKIVYPETSQIQLVRIIIIEVTCVVLNTKKKCPGEESYQGDKPDARFETFGS